MIREAKKLRTVENGEKEEEGKEEGEDKMKETEREEEVMEEEGEETKRGGCGVEEEAGELAPLTHSRRGVAVPVAVHRQLPSWVSHPRLVEGDLATGSAPLDSLPLPSVVVASLQAMGFHSLFPVQVSEAPSEAACL